MEILNKLVIERRTPRYSDDKPYRLYIYGNGPVGDKLNMSSGIHAEVFPVEATMDFETKEEAIESYYRFYRYVEMKIKQAKAKPSKANSRPAYYLWS